MTVVTCDEAVTPDTGPSLTQPPSVTKIIPPKILETTSHLNNFKLRTRTNLMIRI